MCKISDFDYPFKHANIYLNRLSSVSITHTKMVSLIIIGFINYIITNKKSLF